MRTNEMVQVMGTLIEIAFIYKIEIIEDRVMVYFLNRKHEEFWISHFSVAMKRKLVEPQLYVSSFHLLPENLQQECKDEAKRKREELVAFLLARKGTLMETLHKFEL
jgi:hypothetical protein